MAAAAAVLAFAGVFGVLAGLLIAASTLAMGTGYAGLLGAAGPAMAAAAGVAGVAVGGAQVVAARGLWRLRPWASRAAVAFGAAGSVLALLRLGADDPLAPLVAAILSAVPVVLVAATVPRRALGRG